MSILGISKKVSKEEYDAGFNCGLNEEVTENYHFSIFSFEENIVVGRHDDSDGKANLETGKKLRTLYIFSK